MTLLPQPVSIALALFLIACGAEGAGPGNPAAPEPTPERTAPPESEPAAQSEGQPEPEREPVDVGVPTPEAPVQDLSLGASHGCVLSHEGDVRCWGSHQFGQLGDPDLRAGPVVSRPRPAPVAGLDHPVRLAAGSFHHCALEASGQVACWGHGGFGQLGRRQESRDDALTPVRAALDRRAIAVAAGERHTCAILSSEELRCWGDSSFGQLGGASLTEPVSMEGEPLLVSAVAAGRYHTCALTRDPPRRLLCWGAGFSGAVGPLPRPEGFTAEPRELWQEPEEGLETLGLRVGSDHGCLLRGDERPLCWGTNGFGQLGRGRPVWTEPRALAALREAPDELAAGPSHQCALLGDSVECWGSNGKGQLGDGSRTPRRQARAVRLPPASAVALGAKHTCAIATRGEGHGVFCWGAGSRGQLGRAVEDYDGTPRPVPGLRLTVSASDAESPDAED